MARYLETDLIIVGGGAAGTKAALEAQDLGLDPLVVVKGLLGKSGCSIFAGNLLAYDSEGKNKEEKAKDWLEFSVRYYNHYLVDQDYVKEMGRWVASEFYKELEEKGIYFRRDKEGRLVTSVSPVEIMAAHKQGASGNLIMDLRRREVLARKIRLLEECVVTSLLTNNGEVVGITALNLRTGEFYVIRAKAVIMATGQSDGMASRSTATRDQTADGVAMAYRVGAELQNLEIQWWHTSDFAAPRTWMRLHIYPNPLLGTAEVARMYNAKGEMFYEQKRSPVSAAPYPDQLRRLAQQVGKGLARWDGDYFTSYDHIDRQTMMAYNTTSKFWKKLGLDVGRDKIECGITWHMRHGGIHTNPHTMETSVPGLYVAGAVGGHYLCGIGPVSYDGMLAAHSARERAKSMDLLEIDQVQARQEEERVFGLLRTAPRDGIVPMHVKNRIREIMWEKMGYVKNQRKMEEALELLRQVRENMLSRMRLESTSTNFNTAWVDALDVYSLLDVAEVTIHSAMYRKESRGPFYREDYPYTDNKNWLVKVIVKKTAAGLLFSTEPYEMKYIGPRRDIDPFFDEETDY